MELAAVKSRMARMVDLTLNWNSLMANNTINKQLICLSGIPGSVLDLIFARLPGLAPPKRLREGKRKKE